MSVLGGGSMIDDWIDSPFPIIPIEERVIPKEVASCKGCYRLMKIIKPIYQLCNSCNNKNSKIYRPTDEQKYDRWVAKSKEKHGDYYDYSKVNYVRSRDKVIIICPKHGEFSQVASEHYVSGCKPCGTERSSKSRVKSKEQWVAKSKETHGDYYDYSKVIYVRSRDKVIIICPKHGEFSQVASEHYISGCNSCGTERSSKSRTNSREQWLQKAKKTHGDKVFDYSLVPESVRGEDYVDIICSNGHKWNISFQNHCYQSGCPACYNLRRGETLRYTQAEWIAKAQEKFVDKYDYSKVNYTGSYDSITISCPDHGEFTTNPAVHLHSLIGCSKCADIEIGVKRRLTQDQVIAKARLIHGDKYDYSKLNYTTTQNKITIICPEHGEFELQANEHINLASGCRFCCRHEVHPADYIKDCIRVHGNTYDLSKVNYVGYYEEITPICPIHGLFRTKAGNFIRGGCGSCAEYGFKSSKPAYCYLVEYQFSDGTIRYKQGITNNEVKHRVVTLSREVNKVFPATKVTLIDQKYFETGQDAKDLETYFLSLKDIRWIPEIKFDGFTEMYAEGFLQIWDENTQLLEVVE